MSVFRDSNRKFFYPLCCKNREIYFGAMQRLIEREENGEDLDVYSARDTIFLYLCECRIKLETENIGEEVSGARDSRENASAILRYFDDCGWVSTGEMGRNGNNAVYIAPSCRSLIEAVPKIFQQDSGSEVANSIADLYNTLAGGLMPDSIQRQHPYQSILKPLYEKKEGLKKSLINLRDSIREITRSLTDKKDLNSLGQYYLRDELVNSSFEQYFDRKKEGTAKLYIDRINGMLIKVKESELYEKIKEDCKKSLKISGPEAEEKTDLLFNDIENFLNNEYYPRYMDRVDEEISRYTRQLDARIQLAVSGSENIGNVLGNLLLSLKNMEPEEREKALGVIAGTGNIQSYKYVGKRSFQRREKSAEPQEKPGLPQKAMSEEERKRRTEELLRRHNGKYSTKNITDYFGRLMAGKDQITAEDSGFETREDVLKYMSSIICAHRQDFPYEIEISNKWVSTKAADVKEVTVRRKGKQI